MKAHRRVDVQFYFLFNFGARWGWEVNANFRPLYPRERGWVGHRVGQDWCGKCVNVCLYIGVMLTGIFEPQ
jgi:hypothetical protein